VNIFLTKKIMKYVAFCGGGKKQIVRHVLKNSVSILVDSVYKTWCLEVSGTFVLHMTRSGES
jgi:hypothetical protein